MVNDQVMLISVPVAVSQRIPIRSVDVPDESANVW